MKAITIFTSNDYATDQRMQRVVDAFVYTGWSVHVIATLKKKSLPIQTNGFEFSRHHIRPERGPLFYAFMNLKFFRMALRSKSNYLMAVDVDTLMGIKIAAGLTGKTLIWDCHEIFTEMPELYSKPVVKKIWTLIEKKFAENLKYVTTVTVGVAEYLKSKLNIQATIVHNYPRILDLNTDVYKRFESKTILFQGALNEGRCLIDLIKAMKFLPDSFQLVIAGDGHLRPILQGLVKKKALGKKVNFTGQLSPAELREITQKAFVGISLLNKAHKNSMVSLANKNLDYIMSGLPCITVNMPEYLAINQKWEVAVLLDTVSSATIADAILNLSNDFHMYINMHKSCLEARKTLNWENEVKKLYTFIDNLP